MLPGTLLATVFGDQLKAALDDTGSVNYWLLAGAVLLIAVATWWVRRWLLASAAQLRSDEGARINSRKSHGVGQTRTA